VHDDQGVAIINNMIERNLSDNHAKGMFKLAVSQNYEKMLLINLPTISWYSESEPSIANKRCWGLGPSIFDPDLIFSCISMGLI
jgi:hypothetical protein